MKVMDSAPSNIALIKYMGKFGGQKAVNSSISYSLDYLRTFVELEESNEPEDQWKPLMMEDSDDMVLSESGAKRFLAHLQMLKTKAAILDPAIADQKFIVRSSNNFPSDCGLASSASSFAALTLTFAKWLKESKSKSLGTIEQLASLSREGSGSSGRSFFTPWALWKNDQFSKVEGLPHDFKHWVVLCDREKKEVSSSEAHKRVGTSLLMKGRIERAEDRLDHLMLALKARNWNDCFELCWAEFWDMHVLFETSTPSFGYMNGLTLEVLNTIREFWRTRHGGPIVTMDAGANVHCLWPQEMESLQSELLQRLDGYEVLSSHEI